MNRVLDERERKRSVYSIATCSAENEQTLLDELGLTICTLQIEQTNDTSIAGYEWSDLPENNAEQRGKYKLFLEEHLHDALFQNGVQQDFLIDVSEMTGLLNLGHTSNLPFTLKGTTDLVIVNRYTYNIHEIFPGLRFVIELKKKRGSEISNQERLQLLLRLISAHLKSEENCAPVGLLTNLNDYWQFVWFAAEKKIVRLVLTNPAKGLQTMKEIMSGRTMDTEESIEMPITLVERAPKRQRLIKSNKQGNSAAAEMLERYELMADELEPEFLQKQRIEYAFNLVRQTPLFSSMYT
ncbi:Crinkler (CRN) family protein [Thraustotheca clavata]|uniref:Crinkler (CRN) family protein n=1 Tax=Thraustotheca clavata TaxID=74557 RepID=A0A1V9ZWK4_9STRA|nr:Crinkler (CRN) family protein [Thraustotheca clavata]